MSDQEKPPSLDDFEARLRSARGRGRPHVRQDGETAPTSLSGLGLAFRIGVELVAALGIGVGIGLLLDSWLGTQPWLLVLFFFLGAAAGMLNVYRAVSGLGMAPGYRSGPSQPQDGTKNASQRED